MGRCLRKREAEHLGLPWAPPPDLNKIEQDGFQACWDWYEKEMEAAAEMFARGETPEKQITPYIENPWPQTTDEGKAWIRGWNRGCVENCLDEER